MTVKAEQFAAETAANLGAKRISTSTCTLKSELGKDSTTRRLASMTEVREMMMHAQYDIRVCNISFVNPEAIPSALERRLYLEVSSKTAQIPVKVHLTKGKRFIPTRSDTTYLPYSTIYTQSGFTKPKHEAEADSSADGTMMTIIELTSAPETRVDCALYARDESGYNRLVGKTGSLFSETWPAFKRPAGLKTSWSKSNPPCLKYYPDMWPEIQRTIAEEMQNQHPDLYYDGMDLK